MICPMWLSTEGAGNVAGPESMCLREFVSTSTSLTAFLSLSLSLSLSFFLSRHHSTVCACCVANSVLCAVIDPLAIVSVFTGGKLSLLCGKGLWVPILAAGVVRSLLTTHILPYPSCPCAAAASRFLLHPIPPTPPTPKLRNPLRSRNSDCHLHREVRNAHYTSRID